MSRWEHQPGGRSAPDPVERTRGARQRERARSVPGKLEFLSVGTLPPNPGEFLGTNAISEILSALSERSDLVFVDAPPLLSVGDTLPLSARVDAVVVVTRFGIVSRSMLTDLARALQTIPTEKLGVVITGTGEEERTATVTARSRNSTIASSSSSSRGRWRRRGLAQRVPLRVGRHQGSSRAWETPGGTSEPHRPPFATWLMSDAMVESIDE